MKGKKLLILIFLLVFMINYNVVSAANSFSGGNNPACGFDYMPERLPSFVSGLYNILKLLIPIILIVMGMVDFTKAMMSNEDKKIKDSQKKFINRLLAGVVIFLIMAVVQFVFKKIDVSTSYNNGFINCVNCILNGDTSACSGETNNIKKHCEDYEGRYCPIVNGDDYGNQCKTYDNGSSYGGCQAK